MTKLLYCMQHKEPPYDAVMSLLPPEVFKRPMYFIEKKEGCDCTIFCLIRQT